MPTIKLHLKKLTSVDVQFVSIVKRGANRIPIRVVKSEDSTDKSIVEETVMPDFFFKNLFKTADESSAVVSAIIVPKAKADSVLEATLKEKGFKVDKKLEQDNTVIYEQDVPFQPEDQLIKLSDDAFVAVANVQKSFSPFNTSGNFSANFKKGSFFPSMRIASEVLGDTILNIMLSDDTKTTPVSEVQKALDEFGTFVIGALKAIPKEAFKLDGLMASSKDEGEVPNTQTEDEAVNEDKIQEMIKKSMDEFLTTEQEQVLKKVGEAVGAMKTDILKGIEDVKKSLTNSHDALSKKVEGIETTLKNQQGVIDGYDTKMKAIADSASEASESAKKSEEQVTGALQSGSSDADPAETKKEKAEDDPERIFKANAKGNDDGFWGGAMEILDQPDMETA